MFVKFAGGIFGINFEALTKEKHLLHYIVIITF